MLEQSMQTKRPSSHCHKGHKTDQPGGCNSQIQKQNKGKFLCHLISLTLKIIIFDKFFKRSKDPLFACGFQDVDEKIVKKNVYHAY